MKKLFVYGVGVFFVFALMGHMNPAQAAYPTKAIQFIIPFGAGGGADIEGRLLSKEMSKLVQALFSEQLKLLCANSAITLESKVPWLFNKYSSQNQVWVIM